MNLEQKLRSIDQQIVAMAMPVGSALIEFVRFNVFDFKAMHTHGKPVWRESMWRPARYLAFIILAGEPDNIEMIDVGEAEPIEERDDPLREQLLDAAARVFASKGYAGTKIQDIVREAGLSTGATSMKIRYQGPLVAPIAKGQQVAELVVTTGDTPPQTVPLVAANDVGRAGFFGRIWLGLKSLFGMA